MIGGLWTAGLEISIDEESKAYFPFLGFSIKGAAVLESDVIF